MTGGGIKALAGTLVKDSSIAQVIFNIPANQLTVGSQTLTATYGGDANDAAAIGTEAITVTE